MTGRSTLCYDHGMFRASLIALVALTGCQPSAAPEAAATAPTPARAAQIPTANPVKTDVRADPTEPAGPAAEAADPKEQALLLAHGVRNRLAQGDLAAWLGPRAVYPFDLDGKDVAANATELAAKLPTYTATWAQQVETNTRCEAQAREDILAGAPLHYLDRLGNRPPAAELARVLDLFGLGPGELFINCYTPETGDAGYTVIARRTQAELRLEAFRN